MDTTQLLEVAAFAATIGAGLFLAFSTAVMPGLAGVPAAQAAAVMQAVNRAILNPLFGLVFGGTTVLCVLVAATAAVAGAPLRLAGALLLVAGAFGVTMVVNVPLNTALDQADAAGPEAGVAWERFAGRWTRWNHVRPVASTAATVLLALSGPLS